MDRRKKIAIAGIIAMMFMAPMVCADSEDSDGADVYLHTFDQLKGALNNESIDEVMINGYVVVPEGEPLTVRSGMTLGIDYNCSLILNSPLTVEGGATLNANIYGDNGNMTIKGTAPCIFEQGSKMTCTQGPKAWRPATLDILGPGNTYPISMNGCTDVRIAFNDGFSTDYWFNGGRVGIMDPIGTGTEFVIGTDDIMTIGGKGEVLFYCPVLIEGDVIVDEDSNLTVEQSGSINTADVMKGDPSLTVNGLMYTMIGSETYLKSCGDQDGASGKGFALTVNGKLECYGKMEFGTCAGNIASPAVMTVYGSMVSKMELLNEGIIGCAAGGTVDFDDFVTNNGSIVNNGTMSSGESITGTGYVYNNSVWYGRTPKNFIDVDSVGVRPVTDGTTIETATSAVSFTPSADGASGDAVTVRTAGRLSVSIDAGGLAGGDPVTVMMKESAKASEMAGRVYVVNALGVVPGTPLAVTLPASFADTKVHRIVDGADCGEMPVIGRTATTVTFAVAHDSEFAVVGVADTVKGTANKVTLGPGTGFVIDNTTGPDTPDGTFAFSVAPVDGYRIDKVDASNGTVAGNGPEYTLSGVTADTTISITASEDDGAQDDTTLYIIIGAVAAVAIIGVAVALVLRKKP